jgi:hypothetical protein
LPIINAVSQYDDLLSNYKNNSYLSSILQEILNLNFFNKKAVLSSIDKPRKNAKMIKIINEETSLSQIQQNADTFLAYFAKVEKSASSDLSLRFLKSLEDIRKLV